MRRTQNNAHLNWKSMSIPLLADFVECKNHPIKYSPFRWFRNRLLAVPFYPGTNCCEDMLWVAQCLGKGTSNCLRTHCFFLLTFRLTNILVDFIWFSLLPMTPNQDVAHFIGSTECDMKFSYRQPILIAGNRISSCRSKQIIGVSVVYDCFARISSQTSSVWHRKHDAAILYNRLRVYENVHKPTKKKLFFLNVRRCFII